MENTTEITDKEYKQAIHKGDAQAYYKMLKITSNKESEN